MRSYEVTFYRHLVNSTGELCRSRLTSVQINDCTNKRAACDLANRRFEDSWALSRWRNLAHEFEIRERQIPKRRNDLAA